MSIQRHTKNDWRNIEKSNSMIRCSELQIGDYVLVDGTPRRVASITKKKIGYHINPQTDNRLYYARLHNVEPIEITRELLINLGFVEYKTIPYDAYIHNGGEARLFCYPLNRWRTVNAVGRMVDMFISYLHQYQQICRLEQVEIDWKF